MSIERHFIESIKRGYTFKRNDYDKKFDRCGEGNFPYLFIVFHRRMNRKNYLKISTKTVLNQLEEYHIFFDYFDVL